MSLETLVHVVPVSLSIFVHTPTTNPFLSMNREMSVRERDSTNVFIGALDVISCRVITSLKVFSGTFVSISTRANVSDMIIKYGSIA